MKKPLVTGCIVVAVIAGIIAIACAGFTWWGGSQFMGNNTKITKEIIGANIPDGYMPMFAVDLTESGKDQKFAMLIGQNSSLVFLLSGPKALDEKSKEDFIETFKQSMNKGQSTNQESSFTEDGNITLNGKEYPKYKVSTVSKGKEMSGMALFLNYPDKSLLFVYMAESTIYNPEIAQKFLEQIALP